MKESLTRREFIKKSGYLGLGIVGGMLLPAVSEAVRFDKERFKVSRTQLLIGTVVNITLVDESKERADIAAEKAFDEIKRLENILTRFKTESAVGQLNQEGLIRDVPPELKEMVQESLRFFLITKGAFDVTVKPVLDLYEAKFKQGLEPTEEEISRVLKRVGSEFIKVDGKGISFERQGMGITLDGIAKGYIVDKASQALEREGIKNYLINAGGDIKVKGERKEGGPWKIAIQDPQKSGHYPDIIRLMEGAIATSGNYEVYFDNEKLFHHIVNPSSGRSPVDLTSVSVVAKDTKEADALSTALYVMGPTESLGFASSYGCECLLITKDGRLIESKGWRALRA